MRKTLLLAASAAVIAWGTTTAYAQDQDQNDTKAGHIETVTVTAERRSEDVMKTPISADVFSGTDLTNKGIVKVDDLQFSSPSLVVNNFGQGIDFNIRGIGKGEHNSQTMTGVITYRDDVPTFPGYMAEEPYYDIASVQVLRGPQGTFVGQNATGGAVFVKSNDPVIGGGYDGYAMASYGNYSDVSAQGAVNIPISDTFAIRISGFGDRRDTFYHITDNDPADACPGGKYAGCKPGYNPGNVRWGAGRISALWEPNDALKVSFKYDADYLDSGALPASPTYEGMHTLPAAYNPLGGTATTPNPYYRDIFDVTANAPMKAVDRFNRAVLRVDYTLPNGIDLRSVSGYQYGDTTYQTDLDGTDYGALNYPTFTSILVPPFVAVSYPNYWTFFDHVDERIYSQEFNIISPDTDRFTWILGAFGQSDTYIFPPGKFYTGVPHGGFNTDSTLQGKNPNLSFAGFGQAGYKITPALEVQFGARYSYNRSTNDIFWDEYGYLINQHQIAKSYAFTYKGSINWQVNDDNFLYAFISTGYKPGGINPPIYTFYQPPAFSPEKVKEYEVGWKATMLDGHLRTTLDGYYNDYRNFIVTVAYPPNTAAISGFASEVNVPGSTAVSGIEAEVDAVFDHLTFGLGLGLNHSSLGQFYAVDARFAGGATCDPATGPATATCFNLKGRPLTYAPSVTYDLNASYRFDLANGDKITPRVNFGYVGGQWATLFDNNVMGDKLAPRNLLGGQIEWDHDTYAVTLYGTNLTDQHYVGAIISPLRYAGPPRQFGIRVMKVF